MIVSPPEELKRSCSNVDGDLLSRSYCGRWHVFFRKRVCEC